jgi:undecaprenyl-diphosphatase
MSFDTLLTIDYNVFSVVNGLVGKIKILDTVMILIAKYGPLVFDAALVVLWFRGKNYLSVMRNRRRAIYAAVSALIALAINQVVGYTWFRDRPYIHHPDHLLLPVSPDPSFPSDHAAGGFSISTAILFEHRFLGAVLVVFAAILAAARVYVGIHYPSDVLGGAIIGIIAAVITELIKGLLERPIHWILILWRWLENKLPFLKFARF